MVNVISEIEASDNLEEGYDTSDKESVNKARKKYSRTRADRLHFIEASMSVEQGRAWFYDILKRCHVFNTPYVSSDSHGTAFKCGELNIGLMILDDIQTVAPDNYIQMIRENKTKNG